jgi:hypothetical protein
MGMDCRKKTYQAYSAAMRYFIEAVGNKELTSVTRRDVLDIRVCTCRLYVSRSEKPKGGFAVGPGATKQS